MSIDSLFIGQIATIVSFVVALFVLYRLLVHTKDATIEAKDATIEQLKERISGLERDVDVARSEGPDILSQRLTARIGVLNDELERLSADVERNAGTITVKESQLRQAKADMATLQDEMDRARDLMSEFFCPECGAPMVTRDYGNETVEWNGREIDVDHEVAVYECGLTTVDGRRTSPCGEASATGHPSDK